MANAITIKTDLVQAGMVVLSAGQNLRIILDENLVFAKTYKARFRFGDADTIVMETIVEVRSKRVFAAVIVEDFAER